MTISGATVALLGAVVESFVLVTFASDFVPRVPMLLALGAALMLNFFLLACFNFLIYPNFISPLRHLPGPKSGLPIIGRATTMFEAPPGESYYKWLHTYKNSGLVRFQGLWNRDMLLVTSPAALAEMLVAKSYQFQKPENARDQLRMVLGDGLVVVEGDEHKFQRKRVMPSFSFRHIKDLYPVMWGKARNLSERIGADFQGNDTIKVEIMEWASKATLDAIGVAALGRDFNSVNNADDELANIYRLITDPTPFSQIFFAACVLFGPQRIMAIPLPIIKDIKMLGNRLREISHQLVQDKREAIAKHGDDHVDILSILIKSNDFSDTELVDQMLTFLGAGSDTTSLTFTWTCYLLAKYPKMQKKLREELMTVKDQLFNETHATKDDESQHLSTILESLPYLNGVFHEVLRLYPTVPMTQRVAAVDTTILNQPIPKGTEFVLSMNAVNRSPDFWGPDAAEFRPERWIDEKTGKPNNHGGAENNYSLLTFLAGPRSCIGQNFARAELRCMLAAWVLSYDIEDANEKEPLAVGAVTTKPLGGMWLKLRRINTAQ